ncbi:hypothetical protein JCM5296_002189 [Sporobolomyces johnsonii]
MYPKLVSYCTRSGVTLTISQAQGIWQRQYGIYKRCKQADETRGGASGDLDKAAREEASAQCFSKGIKDMVRVAGDRNRAAQDRNRVTQDNADRQWRADTARFLLERDDIDEELKQWARAFIAQDLTF